MSKIKMFVAVSVLACTASTAFAVLRTDDARLFAQATEATLTLADVAVTLKSGEKLPENRIAACNAEIVAAHNTIQRLAPTHYSAKFAEARELLAEAAKRITTNPNAFAFENNPETLSRIGQAQATLARINKAEPLSRQNVATTAWYAHLFGKSSLTEFATNRDLLDNEATRDLTKVVAASCAPAVYTQNQRLSSLKRFEAKRDEYTAFIQD